MESYHSFHSVFVSHEDAWYFYVRYTDNSVAFDLHGGPHDSFPRDNIPCPIGSWYYVVGTWSNPLDRLQLFGNGILKDTYVETLSMRNSPDHFTVGYQDNNGNYFDGVIDEIRISDIERSES